MIELARLTAEEELEEIRKALDESGKEPWKGITLAEWVSVLVGALDEDQYQGDDL